MRHPEGGGWRCSYGTWHGIDEHCRCAPSRSHLTAAVADPAALPAERPGTTVRYHIDEHRTPCLRAVTHPAETVVRRPHFAKEATA
jgi:hypothetical protein